MRSPDTSTLGGRIRYIRQTQPGRVTIRQYGDRIGVSESAMTSYELGNVSPPVTVIHLICDRYGVNQHWLETGEGEPYIPQDADAALIDAALTSGDPLIRALLAGIVRRPEGWRMLAEAVITCADTLRAQGIDVRMDDQRPGGRCCDGKDVRP